MNTDICISTTCTTCFILLFRLSLKQLLVSEHKPLCRNKLVLNSTSLITKAKSKGNRIFFPNV